MAERTFTNRSQPQKSASGVVDARRLSTWVNGSVKRCFDFLVAGLGLLLLCPFWLWIGWRIQRDSPGPVLFHARRVGLHGKVFSMLKFRTMFETPESYQGPRVTAQDDPRVTHFGRWLRRTKLNELPQLFNVLRGDMSLVGPRPEDPQISAAWSEEVSKEVLSVRPGMTSPASVLYRDEEKLLDPQDPVDSYLQQVLPSKLRLDQLYVRHRSFWLDLDILFWTLLVLLPKLRVYPLVESRLFTGPISTAQQYLRWFAVDTLVTLFSIALVGLLWRSTGPLNIGWMRGLGMALGFAFLFSLSSFVFRVNRISWSQAAFRDAFDLLPPAILATLCALILNRIVASQSVLEALPVGMILIAAGLSFFGFVVARYRSRLFDEIGRRWLILNKANAAQERVLIVGSGESGQFATWLLQYGKSGSLFQVVGFIDDDLYKQNLRIHGVQVLGRREDLPRLVAEHDVGLIIFAIHNIAPEDRRQLLGLCSSTPARLLLLPDWNGRLSYALQDEGFSADFDDQVSISAGDIIQMLDEIELHAGNRDYQRLTASVKKLRDMFESEQDR